MKIMVGLVMVLAMPAVAEVDCLVGRRQSDGGVYTELVTYTFPGDAGFLICGGLTADGGDPCAGRCPLRQATGVEVGGKGEPLNQTLLVNTGAALKRTWSPTLEFTGCTGEQCTGVLVPSEPVHFELGKGTEVFGRRLNGPETLRVARGAFVWIKLPSLLTGAVTVHPAMRSGTRPVTTVIGPNDLLYSVGNVVRARAPRLSPAMTQDLIFPQTSWSDGLFTPDCAGQRLLRGQVITDKPAREGHGFLTGSAGVELTEPVAAQELTVSFWFQWLGAQQWQVDGTLRENKPKTSAMISSCQGRACTPLVSLSRGLLGWASNVSDGKGVPFEPDVWHHLAFVRRLKGADLYLDGEPVTSTAPFELARIVVGGATALSATTADGGVDPTETEVSADAMGCQGRLDDVKLFLRALSADQVRADMARPQRCTAH